MSNLIRWEPEREMMTLREAMDHLFDEAFTRPTGMARGMSALSINMHETDDDLVVTTPVPGLKPEEVEITITGDFLTIKGEYREKEEKKAKTFHLREQRFGTFHRSIGLPTRIETEKVKAEFEDGMLTITLPKAESAKPKTVTIKAK